MSSSIMTTLVSFRQDNVDHPLFFSRLTNTGGITVEHHISPQSKVSGDYAYLRSVSFDKYDQGGFLIGTIAPTHVVMGTYDYNLTPSLLEASGGYVRSAINSYIVSGLVEKHFERMVLLAGFSRYLSRIGNAVVLSIEAISGVIQGRSLPPNNINDTFNIRVKGDVSPRVMLGWRWPAHAPPVRREKIWKACWPAPECDTSYRNTWEFSGLRSFMAQIPIPYYPNPFRAKVYLWGLSTSYHQLPRK